MENDVIPSSDAELPRRRATLRDIAERIGLSINTVSAVLNPRSRPIYISAATRAKVEAAARELNYTRNVAASRLAGGRSRLLGVLMSNPEDPGEATTLCAFEAAVAERRYQMIVCCAGTGGARCADSLRHFGEHNAEGIFITMVDGSAEIREAVGKALAAGSPSVVIDADLTSQNGSLVGANHHLGGQLLAQHLVNNGHRSFMFLSPSDQMNSPQVRGMIDGAQNIFEQYGLQAPFEGIGVPLGSPEVVAQNVVERLKAGNAPSAVLCSSDPVAIQLIMGLQAAGYRVPEDIAVTGYGNVASAWHVRSGENTAAQWPWGPGLTTIKLPWGEIGTAAAEALISQIEGRKDAIAQRRILPVELSAGGSSALPSNR